MRKKVNKIISIVLSIFVFILLGINILSLTTRGNNHGVPKIFGHSYLSVLTDSMEPTLKVKSLVVVKEVDPSTLVAQQKDSEGNVIVEGDIITFYREGGNGMVVTHRLVDISPNPDGTYQLYVIGDNMHASSCPASGCSSVPEEINSRNLMGKVTYHSYGLGVCYNFLTNPIVSFCLIMIPGGYVLISSLVDFIHQAKLLKKENELEKEKAANGEETHEEELARLKEEMKNQIKEEMKNKEKEEKVKNKKEED